MFSGLLALVVIIGIVYLSYKFPGKKSGAPTGADSVPSNADSGTDAADRDRKWRDYIASFRTSRTGNAAELKLIDDMLLGKGAPDVAGVFESQTKQPARAAEASRSVAVVGQAPAVSVTPPKPAKELDGTLLLLYFGAFLFVAAAGLFVAFGGVGGELRTLLVLLTALALYACGLWLYGNSKRLQPAGVAFTAIGMAVAPLTGMAAFYYVTSETHAGAVWLLTSLLCVGMYVYAAFQMRTEFISYLLILSLVSLFESMIAVVQGPLQFYFWMLIAIGFVLRFVGVVRDNPVTSRSAFVSAQIAVPVALAMSLWSVGQHGLGQFGVSLLLAGAYYAYEAYSQPKHRVPLAFGAHVSLLLGVVAMTYDITRSGTAVAITLLFATLVHAVIISALAPTSEIGRNVGSLAFVAALVAAVLSYDSGVLVAASVAVMACVGVIVAMHQRRTDGYAGAGLAFIALPFVIGQLTIQPGIGAAAQTALAMVPFVTLWVAANLLATPHLSDRWKDVSTAVYGVAGLALLVPAFFGDGGWLCILACYAFAATLVKLAIMRREAGWWLAAGLVVSIPVVRELFEIDTLGFSVAVVLALLTNIAMTLFSRSEGNRWLMTCLGLLLPLAVGAGGFGWNWNAAGYAYGYMFVVCGLVLSRALAVGALLVSSKRPLVSYYRSTSMSYVLGYVTAAAIAVGCSLVAEHSRVHTSIILAALFDITWILALYVEKNRQLLALLPWLLAGLIISVMRPESGTLEANLLILAVSVVAVIGYAAVRSKAEFFGTDLRQVQQSNLILAYTAVALSLFFGVDQIIPATTLATAGFLTLAHVWHGKQSEREVAASVVVAAVLWVMYAQGVTNIQAYTHVLAAMFGAYALWRHVRGDRANSDNYLYVMLGTATIPLVLQALSGTAGDVYGWWLLLEQVGFMVLGIMIGRRFVTFWGLYVAIGAVLYQLRHLGWAALSFLALFIIGIAIYRLVRGQGGKQS